MATQRFDRRYFDHWYREEGFGSPAVLDRKVRYALGAAEYLLERPVRSVLDVGCGEGSWFGAVRAARPRARYVGIDPSAYAVSRYGRSRHLRLGGLADLDRLGLRGPFDLVVCVDVLAYAPDPDVRAGLRSMSRLLGGVALIEVFTSEDHFVGDTEGYRPRRPATYRRWFAEAGLCRIGPSLFADESLRPHLSVFERGW
jgi:SAM-dependent methyltransferase